MTRLVLVLALVACAKKSEEPPPAPTNNAPAIPAAEMKRGEDACKAYIDQACACAEKVPAATDRCASAKAFGEALRMGTELSMSTDSTSLDVKQAAMTIRKTIAACIEETAQLPGLGCTR